MQLRSVLWIGLFLLLSGCTKSNEYTNNIQPVLEAPDPGGDQIHPSSSDEFYLNFRVSGGVEKIIRISESDSTAGVRCANVAFGDRRFQILADQENEDGQVLRVNILLNDTAANRTYHVSRINGVYQNDFGWMERPDEATEVNYGPALADDDSCVIHLDPIVDSTIRSGSFSCGQVGQIINGIVENPEFRASVTEGSFRCQMRE